MGGNPGQACPHLAQEGLFRGFRCLVGVRSSREIAGLLREFPEVQPILFSEDEVRVEPGGLRVGLCVGRDSMSSLVWSNAAAFSRCDRIG